MPKQITQPETLFDDNTFANTERIISNKEPLAGVSVELGARALALNNIMETFNYLNKRMKAVVDSQSPDSKFNARYEHPEEVLEMMGKKAATMLHFNKDDYRTLNATTELIDAGFHPQKVDMQERQIRKDLINSFGPGKAHSPDRKKVVQRASTAAIQVNQINTL